MTISPPGIPAASPGDGPARLFIALWPPPAVAAALHARGALACAGAPARREPPERLHLTLHFLGAVPRDRVPALQAALCLPLRPFELRFGACTRWPSGVLVAEPLHCPPALLALHATLAQALAALGLRTEARAFRPHVTLARRRAGPGPATPAPVALLRWRVRRCVLVESWPGPPPQYRVLKSGRARTTAVQPGLAQLQCRDAAPGVSLQPEPIGVDKSDDRGGRPPPC